MRSKPLADDAECPFVRNIFVIFSRITLSFKKKNLLPLFISYLPHGYKPSQKIRDLDKPPVISGLNTTQTELNGSDFHYHL